VKKRRNPAGRSAFLGSDADDPVKRFSDLLSMGDEQEYSPVHVASQIGQHRTFGFLIQ